MTKLNLRTAANRVGRDLFTHFAVPLLLGLALMTSSATSTTAQSAHGLTNPTLALNLSSVRDWAPGLQFLDIAKMMRPLGARTKDGKSNLKWADMKAQGYLDSDGWPITIPQGYDEIGTIFEWSSLPDRFDHNAGRYVLTYDGKGTIELRLDPKIVSQKPGRIVFDSKEGRTFFLAITQTDPLNEGDHIRNISIVAERNLDLHAIGAVFNPDWVRLIADARQLRFMGWNDTINSRVVTWEDRSTPTGAHDGSVPVEYMVQLANEVGAEPWFTMPHMADETYIRNFAAYVRDHLDPALPIRVEYSNEVWNWGYQQAQWALQQAREKWNSDDQVSYHTKKAVETALIWNDVFGTQAESRLIHVLGAQAVNTWRTGIALRADTWRNKEPDRFVAPETVFDELAITHYFGGHAMTDEGPQAELLAAIKDPTINTNAYLAAKLRDPDYKGSLPERAAKWREHADLAHQYGLKLTAYEGGQHEHQLGKTGSLSEADRALLEQFMIDFVRSPEMAALYAESWQIWSGIGDGPFMQLGDMIKPSKYGSWGMYESLDTPTLRGDVLNALNASETPWWDTAPNPAFQQGVTQRASGEDDTMTGTVQEDYLLAGDGDDTIIETAGNDGVHGGNGTDRVVLSDKPSAYTIRPERGGYAVTGPQGNDFYFDIEIAVFAGNQQVTLADVPLGPDGTLALPEDQAQNTTPATIRVAQVGDLVDASGADGIAVAAGSRIEAINIWSTLGTELELRQSADPRPSYVIMARGAEAIIGTQTVKANYWSTQENRPSAGGLPLTDSAVTTTRLLASIALYVGQVVGSDGNDNIFGRDQSDIVHAGDGRDLVATRAGDDSLYGQDGNDMLFAGPGDDLLVGGPGNDRLVGEEGRDRYVFAAGCGQDTVVGFSVDDTLELAGFLPLDQLLGEIATQSDAGLILSNGADSILFVDMILSDLDWMTVLRT